MAFIEPMHHNKPNITYLLTTYCTDLLQQCDILCLSETWLRPCELSSIEKCLQGGVNGNIDVFAKSGMVDIEPDYSGRPFGGV